MLLCNNDLFKQCFLFYSKGPLEFVEPDLSSLPPPRPMSPDGTANDKRDSISDKAKQGRLERKWLFTIK